MVIESSSLREGLYSPWPTPPTKPRKSTHRRPAPSRVPTTLSQSSAPRGTSCLQDLTSKHGPEYAMRGDGDWITDIPSFADVTAPISRRHQACARSSSTNAKDHNINTTKLTSQYCNSTNLIGTQLTPGNILSPSSSKKNADRNTNASIPILPALSQQSSKSIEKSSATVYGIVMYDFKAERPNELEAKAGEAITVVAQSHPEWFVAQHVGRSGSPGLIPVSFVEVRDEATGTAVSNAQDAIKRAGVPRVEEWKTAPSYEHSSMIVGKADGHISNFGVLFRACVPTKERLMILQNGWTNTKSLYSRLLYCQSFNIVFIEQGELVMQSHDDMVELLEHGNIEIFFDQVAKEWPESFGWLHSLENAPGHFQWHPAEPPRLDDGTVFLCRVAARNGEREPLEALVSPETFFVYQYPTDNMLWQIMPKINTSVLTMRTIAFLENLFAPTHDTSNLPSYGSLNDWFPIQTTTPVLRSTGHFGVGNWFCIQLNLRACIPDEKGHRNKHFKRAWGISPKRVGLPLNRQTAQIPDLSKSCNMTAIEYLLSVSMVLRKTKSANAASALKYDIVAWADYDADFQATRDQNIIFPVLSHRIDMDLGLEDCGSGGEAVFQFIMVLAKSINHWKVCWDHMIDKIDDIISVQLQDTLDKKRWNSLMFDDSLQLSEQYFTILQLLRICQNWIGEAERGIENLGDELIQKCESWKAWQQLEAQNDLFQWHLDMTKLKHNVKCLQDFFGTRASPLRERIKIKKDEVASLQDALLSTSSLRETLKAKTLNLYIGVFTTVTVFFTPLGFIATLWTIPFLQTNLDGPVPKGFTASFVTVPILTYILSGFIILYFWAKSSRHSDIMNLVVFWVAFPTRVTKAIWARSLASRIIGKVSIDSLREIITIPNFIHDRIRRNRSDPSRV